MVVGRLDEVYRLGALVALGLSLGIAPAAAQDAKRPWLDPTLLAAAQKEGPLVVYSSMNEQEGLPLFKIFTDATGIKVNYVRAADTPLMGRIAIEFRTKQKAWDVLQTTTINKVPAPMLAQIDLSEAKALNPEAIAPDRRWYGMYANYNGPAYNTKLVQPSDLPKTYEELISKKQWANRVAIDGTDNEWLKAMFEFYGEAKATEIIKGIVTKMKPIVTD
jgi:iron(III) transport system substrate-binding protein